VIQNFPYALHAVRRWEGGLSDHPSDPGGLTKWGISLRFLRAIGFDVNGDGVLDGHDIHALNESQVADLYRHRFWMVCECDNLPSGLDLAVFDSAVNQGPPRAKKLLQKALGGLVVDGRIGPLTLQRANAKPADMTIAEFMARRALHYSSLANIAVFGLGWFRRLFDIDKRAHGLL
jgi:lysozyme family protein